MKKPTINLIITKEDEGYSATTTIDGHFIGTQGDNFEELKANVLEAVNLAFEDKGLVFSMNEIRFTLDIQSFFEFYKVINAKKLSERIGMNQSLLAQYITGKKKPSPAQTERILNGVQQIGRELTEIRFLVG
jgi:hypothetical protein